MILSLLNPIHILGSGSRVHTLHPSLANCYSCVQKKRLRVDMGASHRDCVPCSEMCWEKPEKFPATSAQGLFCCCCCCLVIVGGDTWLCSRVTTARAWGSARTKLRSAACKVSALSIVLAPAWSFFVVCLGPTPKGFSGLTPGCSLRNDPGSIQGSYGVLGLNHGELHARQHVFPAMLLLWLQPS